MSVKIPRLCEVPGCERKHRGRGLCQLHARRMHDFGSFELRPPPDPMVLWKARYEVVASGCWEWTATLDSQGYGQFGSRHRGKGRTLKAHKWGYEELVGPVPEGLELDHLCRNRRCVNPDHLEPVTHLENLRRRVLPRGPRKTHCRRGHEIYTNAKGVRYCLQCKVISQHAYLARKAAA